MDLSEDEVEEIFPEDREVGPDEADVEPYLSIERDGFEWVVSLDGETIRTPRNPEDIDPWFLFAEDDPISIISRIS